MVGPEGGGWEYGSLVAIDAFYIGTVQITFHALRVITPSTAFTVPSGDRQLGRP